LRGLTPRYQHRSLPPLELELIRPSDSPSGSLRLRFKPTQLTVVQSTAEQPLPTTRLQDVIKRIGEICLSPDVATVMLSPLQALATTQFDLEPQSLDPHAVLQLMHTADTYHASILLARLTAQYLPDPTLVQRPLTLVAWKVETPQRVILYTGKSGLDGLPHTLPKILIDERSRRPDPSAVHLAPFTAGPDADPAQLVRSSLLQHAQTQLAPNPYYQAVAGKSSTPTLVLTHTLEEAFASFINEPTKNISTVKLNQSLPWNRDHIDAR